ncbi:MAG: TolC family protein [Planctomycetes bacterium]|nr:TolC family protein [Planctomycetota bacterium]
MKTLFVCATCLALLAGCQSYEPLPLDDRAHLGEWAKRSPAGKGVSEYVKTLGARDAKPAAPYNPADGISLAEAEVVALFFNPGLRTARLEAGVPLAGALEAGRWEDPELELDATWIIDNVHTPWMLGAGIKFTIPLSGRPGVEQDLAWAEYDVTKREVVSSEWQALVALREQWLEAAELAERKRLLTEFVAALDRIRSVADRLREAGVLSRLDARLFDLEVATRRLELDQLDLRAKEARLRVLQAMGLHPEAPADLRFELALPPLPADNRDTLARDRNADLAVLRARYQVAEQQLRLEVRKQYPDLAIGQAYELDEGQSRISLGFGIPIPIINLNKEGIARARAARLAARSDYEGMLEDVGHELAQAQVALERARRNRRYVAETLSPLVDEQVEAARRLSELGEFDALMQLDALTRQYETRAVGLEAALEEARAATRLLAVLGPAFKAETRPEEAERD